MKEQRGISSAICDKRDSCLFLYPKSDQNLISPHNIDTLSSRHVMRMKKIINQLILPWCNNKFSSWYHVSHWSRVRRIEFLRLGTCGKHTRREDTHHCFSGAPVFKIMFQLIPSLNSNMPKNSSVSQKQLAWIGPQKPKNFRTKIFFWELSFVKSIFIYFNKTLNNAMHDLIIVLVSKVYFARKDLLKRQRVLWYKCLS